MHDISGLILREVGMVLLLGFGPVLGAVQERRHLAAGRVVVGTEHRAVIAAVGDLRPGQFGHRGPIPRTCRNIREPRIGRLSQAVGPRQEHRHLRADHAAVGTEPRTVAAAGSDSEFGHALNERRKETGRVHVIEPRLRHRGGIRAVEEAHDPHRHRLTIQRVVGTEPRTVVAFSAGEHSLGCQRSNRLGVVRIA